MRRKSLKKSGWSWAAFFQSFLWYYGKGMTGKATLMLILTVGTFFLGLIPVMIYCGANGNRDFYLHVQRNAIIV